VSSECAASFSQDAVVFPFFKSHGNLDFSDQSEQHQEIHHYLDGLEKLLTEAKADSSKFDANTIKEVLLRTKTILVSDAQASLSMLTKMQVPHLDNEVAKITPENLKAAGYKEEDLERMMKDAIKHGMAVLKPFQDLPFIRA